MKFRKLPVEIEAIQWTGSNPIDVCIFIGCQQPLVLNQGSVAIETLEGVMEADVSDWIIKGVKGEFYPCKPDIFSMTYDRVGLDEPTSDAGYHS